MQNYYYAVFNRSSAAPKVAPVWQLLPAGAGGPVTYLVDGAPGGRTNVVKLSFTSDGKPTWLLTAGGLPAGAAGAAGQTFESDWHRLTLSDSAKQVGRGSRAGITCSAHCCIQGTCKPHHTFPRAIPFPGAIPN